LLSEVGWLAAYADPGIVGGSESFGFEEAATEGAMGFSEVFEGICGLGGHFEDEMEVSGSVKSSKVAVPPKWDSIFAGIAFRAFARDGVAAPPVSVASDEVVGGDDGDNSFSCWGSFQREGGAAGV